MNMRVELKCFRWYTVYPAGLVKRQKWGLKFSDRGGSKGLWKTENLSHFDWTRGSKREGRHAIRNSWHGRFHIFASSAFSSLRDSFLAFSISLEKKHKMQDEWWTDDFSLSRLVFTPNFYSFFIQPFFPSSFAVPPKFHPFHETLNIRPYSALAMPVNSEPVAQEPFIWYGWTSDKSSITRGEKGNKKCTSCIWSESEKGIELRKFRGRGRE